MSLRNIDDPLKVLDEVHEPDKRQKYVALSLEDLHDELLAIVLDDAVSADVRQLFETAKNVSLYSWFVYRFHQVAELVAFSALEMALRERYLTENPGTERRYLSLGRLVKHARKERWINDAALINQRENDRRRSEIKRGIENIRNDMLKINQSIQIEGPFEDDIEKAVGELDMANYILESAADLRNSLAHGSNDMRATSISVLSITAEMINQVKATGHSGV